GDHDPDTYKSFNRVRKVDAATGIITTVAGGGTPADDVGDGGPATAARLGTPRSIAVDRAGNLFIADLYAHRIRRVDAVSGIITTVAGTGISGLSGDGGPATSAQLAYSSGVALDGAGNMFIADEGNQRIRRVDAVTGIISTFAGTGTGIDFGGGGYGGDGGPATSAQLDFPWRVSVDGAGNVSITTGPRVRRVDTSGIITTVAGTDQYGYSGDGGPAAAAKLSGPGGTSADGSGNLFISDGVRIRRVDPSGIITTVAGGGIGDGFPATSAVLDSPQGLATDASGSVLIADCGHNRVRRVDNASGIITTVAGGGSGGDGSAATSAMLACPTGLAVAGAGTSTPAGTLFIADGNSDRDGCTANKVRKVDPLTGTISTVAGSDEAGFSGDNALATKAKLNCPVDLALDASGNLLIADQDNNRVRKVDAITGKISTVAGDGSIGLGSDGVLATRTSLTQPSGLALDGAGNLLVTDRYARVRKVDAATGKISTVAGEGIPGFGGDGGPATLAQLLNPTQVRADSGGNLFITDRGNNRVRKVEAGTPPPPPPLPASGCGQVITKNTTLASDIGPCSGDGVVIGANGITLNLNGHRIFGPGTGSDGTHPGIRVAGHTGVTIKGATAPGPNQGSVTGFDAGVALIGGSKNTIANLTVSDNYAGQGLGSEFGDGIVLLFSGANTIKNNVVARNGPYDGIGVLGKGSDNNTIQANTIDDTHTVPGDWGYDGTGEGIIFTPFFDISLPRGVTISGNKAVGNTIRRNDTAGISSISNLGAVIQDNTV
ncbi:MAG: right-handed parallel beta-helix repeat-containing protein, partial [Actinobacteria bacterium]|nr:right-handed parallel beta-helix repeat-containing protein [Actinomycetota bacterium]